MRASIVGLSLVELMVALGIVGVLAMLAIPRYQAFMVKARRGEAKSNLSHIASLQSAYRIDYFTYYHADPLSVNGIGYRDGSGLQGQNNCDADREVDKGTCNHLGFDPEGLDELRYLYQVRSSGHAAVASAASDVDRRWIYPDCSGFHAQAECGYNSGDAVTIAMTDSKPVVCRNITKYCPIGTAPPTIVIPPPPPIVLSPPPTPPGTCVNTSDCCDGNTVVANTFGLPCTGGWYGTFDATNLTTYGCCHTAPLTPSTCRNNIQCCDGNAVKARPTNLNLNCESWKGDWDNAADDKGCCKCNAGKTFAYDASTSRGVCCPNSNPVYSYHARTSRGHCCPGGTRYSYDDSGSNQGACCSTNMFYSYDTGNNSGMCCSQDSYWDGSLRTCVAGCGNAQCCQNGFAMTNEQCKNTHGRSFKLNVSTCTCEPCTTKDACDKAPYGDWDSNNGRCKRDPRAPLMSNPMFVQDPLNYCTGWFRPGCDSSADCCTNAYTVKTCPVGKKLRNPPPGGGNSSGDCDCIGCRIDEVCRAFTFNGQRATWNTTYNECRHPDYTNHVFKQKAHDPCKGKFVPRCIPVPSLQCCNGDDFPTASSCISTEKFDASTDCCNPCTQQDACSDANGRWSGGICTHSRDPANYNWMYTSGNCYGSFKKICDPTAECCDGNGNLLTSCPDGEKMTAYSSVPGAGCCQPCTEADACEKEGGSWEDIGASIYTCKHDGYLTTEYKWVYDTTKPCDGRFKKICGGSRCCVGDIFKTCYPDHRLVPYPDCSCVQCTLEYACESPPAYGEWKTDTCTPPPGTSSDVVFVRDPNDPCTGDFEQACPDGECCNADLSTKTDDDCPVGEKVADHPYCNCEPCLPIDACRNSGFSWNNGTNECWRSAAPAGEAFVQYSHDRCRGYFQTPCTRCDPQTQCCISDSLEVKTAADAQQNMTCDAWKGNWNTSAANKGCCTCTGGNIFSYNTATDSGSCCPAHTSWDGTACK